MVWEINFHYAMVSFIGFPGLYLLRARYANPVCPVICVHPGRGTTAPGPKNPFAAGPVVKDNEMDCPAIVAVVLTALTTRIPSIGGSNVAVSPVNTSTFD